MSGSEHSSSREVQLRTLLSLVQKWQADEVVFDSVSGSYDEFSSKEIKNKRSEELFKAITTHLRDNGEDLDHITPQDVDAVKEALNYYPDESVLATLVRKYTYSFRS